MEILQHTDEHTPTLMRDVYASLVGHQVHIYTAHSHPISGKLEAYNGAVVHVVGNNSLNYYVPAHHVLAIGSDKWQRAISSSERVINIQRGPYLSSKTATKRFMPDWQDGDRTWVDLGGDIEASYDGARYIDIRLKATHERLLFISKGALEKAITLFDPPPVCE